MMPAVESFLHNFYPYEKWYSYFIPIVATKFNGHGKN